MASQNTFRKSFTERSAATARRRRRRITGSAWKNFPGTAHTDRQTLLPLYIRLSRENFSSCMLTLL